MAATEITSYGTLRSQVSDHLMRSGDSTFLDAAALAIQLATRRLDRDRRVRREGLVDPFALVGASVALPTDNKGVISLAIQGPEYYGPLDQVSFNEIVSTQRYTGTPRKVAFAGGKAYFGPIPSEPFAGVLVYRQGVATISEASPTNWLLASHPDIYLYACLVEAEAYLKSDERVQLWATQLEQRLEDLAGVQKDKELSAQAQPSTGVVFGG